jgi:hypothetical protein
MNKSVPLSPNFLAAFEGFIEKVNKMLAADNECRYPGSPVPFVVPDKPGIKVIRLIRYAGEGGSGSSYCFVDKANGDVLKCESWKKPAPIARGNIFNADNGIGAVGPYGANYLR